MTDFWFILNVMFFISGFCLGWRTITSKGMILGFIRDWVIAKAIPLWISKPTVLCITCFSSVHGSWIFWLLYLHQDKLITKFTIFEWILCCVTTSFINTVIWTMKEIIEKQNNQ